MKINFLGSIGTVSGSCTEIIYNHSIGYVDSGLFQGPKEVRSRNWATLANAGKAKWVLLTHAHIDHCGYLPKLYRDGFRGTIYCSHETAKLARIMLLDAAHLQEEDARFINQNRHSGHDPALPLYTTEDALAVLNHFQAVNINEWLPLDRGLKYRLHRAGHILGSCFIEINFQTPSGENRILTFSGDLGRTGSLMLKDPESLPETDYVVMESTYGDRTVDKTKVKDQVAHVINEVLGRNGTLLIPAFAVGRTQDILFLITQLESEGKIPKARVVIDSPMASEVTTLYNFFTEELKHDFNPTVRAALEQKRFEFTEDTDASMLLCMDTSSKIVIAGAGMLNGGRIMHHLKTKLSDEKNGVMFVGYQATGTKGLLLKNGLPKIRIHHQLIEVNATIYSVDSLSAHADSEEILTWLKTCRTQPKKVFLNHGEQNALETLKYRILNELKWNCEIPTENIPILLT